MGKESFWMLQRPLLKEFVLLKVCDNLLGGEKYHGLLF